MSFKKKEPETVILAITMVTIIQERSQVFAVNALNHHLQQQYTTKDFLLSFFFFFYWKEMTINHPSIKMKISYDQEMSEEKSTNLQMKQDFS